ncbi:hypothetical protein GCM10007036_30440 [Alsobacter metallidurans]|uniref:Tripartite tricarboxylate transporter substrate binding protein n=1 Tax=Alsobacter metallidurans TaxID=340221 RepID=A0A917I9U4_9HYPH|nr:tripartite tricarboxylate transporter substrate binding protein [Alsobacter metallidurans]GGH24205.1 hypothetical protein GCM10007036_30440 [Alsobacter metallidurans]
MKNLFAAILLLASGAAAVADTYPSKPITLVVGFAPGGGVDVVARQLAEQLSKQMGQRVTVLNKAGAGGNIAAETVAKAEPDGYTLLAENLGIVSINPYLYDMKSFDPEKDFAHIARTVVTPLLIAVPKTSPAKTVADFIALAKEKPGALNYGSGGVGNINHLAVELFASREGVKLQHVPFRGSAPAINELVAGRIDLIVDGVNLVQPFAESGDIRALALTGAARSNTAPDVPTAAEAGVKDFVVLGWQGLAAPAGTPREVLARLDAEVRAALGDPVLANVLSKQGTDPAYLGPDAYASFIAAEKQRWKTVVQETGAQIK